MATAQSHPMVTIYLCVGSSCYVRGSDDVARELLALIREHGLQDSVDIVGTFCLEHCSMGVTLQVDGQVFPEILPESVASFFQQEILPRARVGVLRADAPGGIA